MVTTLVGAGGDAHVFDPSPGDVKAVSTARLVVVNGLGFEGWMTRLIAASGTAADVVIASKGIVPRGDGQDSDPHAWQSVSNAKIYVANIRDALVRADSGHASIYRANADRYLAILDALDREVREAVAQISPDRRKVISTHDAFGYFSAAYGIAFIAPVGLSTEQEVTAGAVARLVRQIRQEKIPALFLENITDPRLMQRIAAETQVKIGGILYSDTLTARNGDAPTYIDMIRHNIKTLTRALSG